MISLRARPAILVAAPLALLLVSSAPVGAAGGVLAGRKKAQQCETCHGLDGLAKIAEAPNIAGQNEQYLIKQLLAFKSGALKSEMMSIVAQALSESDIEDLAAYYAAIEIKVGKIPGQ
ncbi:c-type cytochrome [Pseudaminobacter sp. 19-2017]|uniref:C-type cytochrome n=1 Tax=Pseudaminobacter soli (ex Zhang et al. 2022) TaxID=2831468 RepID=A0A942I2P5_9HYPH|nr:c-type cytochrome [Pseudaminobacter soli]MBS3649053.1 c-type cytochrome [Pseudaminobacter soli]